MRTIIKPLLAIMILFTSCQKNNNAPASGGEENTEEDNKKYGPCGKFSKWKSVAGDSVFSTDLTLTWYMLLKESPCDIHFYEMNYPLWNCYDQNFTISACETVKDTLIIKDKDTHKKAVFTKLK